jgi:hypothetical protein
VQATLPRSADYRRLKMAYMRGDTYVWDDGENIHLWSSVGYDAWDRSNWNHAQLLEHGAESEASGLGLPWEVFDQIVVMRLAELIKSGSLDEVIDRAVEHHGGNFGCEALRHRAEDLKRIQGLLRIERPEEADEAGT